jgi:chemotaxis protein CheD
VSERVVKVADWAADRAETVLVTLGLGSCVAIALYDPAARLGGLAHVLLPTPALARDRSNPAKFPETVVPLLVDRLVALGAARERLRARLVGGSSMFAPGVQVAGAPHMGERNVLAARDALKAARIPIVAEDTGGNHGRSVYFSLDDGRIEIRSVAHGTRHI